MRSRGDVPDSVLQQSKLLPGQVNDTDVMTAELFGGLDERERAYAAIRSKLQVFPDLRRVPAWALRSGMGRRMLEHRLREGERLLN